MLFAVGWIDGELRPSEVHLIMEAAKAEGLTGEELAALEMCCRGPVDFGELDDEALDADGRLYVYAISSWIARTDGRVSPEEVSALHAVATVIGVTGRGRQAMDEVIDGLNASEFSVTVLREAISAKVRALKHS